MFNVLIKSLSRCKTAIAIIFNPDTCFKIRDSVGNGATLLIYFNKKYKTRIIHSNVCYKSKYLHILNASGRKRTLHRRSFIFLVPNTLNFFILSSKCIIYANVIDVLSICKMEISLCSIAPSRDQHPPQVLWMLAKPSLSFFQLV